MFKLLANAIMPLMLVLGLIGNIFCCIVYSRKKFAKFTIRYIFILLGIIDSFYLSLNLTIDYFNYAFDWDLRDQNKPICILINYFGYFIAPLSPWLLCYVSVERLLSISPCFYGLNRLKRINYQSTYFMILVIVNLLYYIPVLYFINIIEVYNLNDSSNNTIKCIKCDFTDLNNKNRFALMDLAYSTLIPGSIMLISTCLIIRCIYKSTSRLFKDTGENSRRRLRKDFKFAITSIFLNIVFITLNLPICIIYLDTVNFSTDNLKYLVSLLMFYATYAVNFYLFLISNSSFRNEFVRLIGFKKLNLHSDVSCDSRRETYKKTKKNELN